MMGPQRSIDDRWILGVCAGLATWLRIQPVWLRLCFAVAALASGIGVAAYFGLALFMRPPQEAPLSVWQLLALNLRLTIDQIRQTIQSLSEQWAEWHRRRNESSQPLVRFRAAIGATALLLGLALLLASFGLFWWLTWSRLLALLFIFAGLGLVLTKRRPR